jgi:CheY-like chemotaxis protein
VQSAVACLESAQFDVLLSDIGLPDGSGHDLMKQARQRQPTVRGIAFSGFGMEEDLRRSKEAGFDYHLTKPVDFQILRESLAKLR